jgi:mannitol/fructose-specific phosphotransferase system IIA component
MKRTQATTIFLLAAFGLAAVLGVSLYRTAEAASPLAVLPHQGGFGRGMAGYSSQELAEALGITVEELNSAYQEATENAINQALADGLITEDQAARMLERGLAFQFHTRGGWLGKSSSDYQVLLADALGISVERLQEAQQQAFLTRIDQAVAAGSLTEEEADFILGQQALFSNETFRSSMQAAFEAAVQQAVAEGAISQSQADQIISRSQTGPGFLNFHGGKSEFGRPGGFGKGMPEDPAFFTPRTNGSDG